MKSRSTPPHALVAGDGAYASAAGWALGSLALATLLSSLGTSIANVALPTLAEAFNVSFQQVQWVVIAYLLAMTTLVTSVGRLGDLAGRRRLLLAGIGVFTLASALCGAAPTLWLLIVARAAQGLGAAVMIALTMAMVGETVPKARSGSAMGLLGTMSAVGTALGPSLGGVLIARAGWPAIFFVLAPLGVLTLLLAQRFLPAEPQGAQPDRVGFDYLGTLLLAVTLAAYALAVTSGRGSFGMGNLALLVMALCGGGLFIVAEAKAPAPLIRLSLFREPALSAGFAMSALATTVVMTTLVVGPFYLGGAFGLDPARVGLIMASGPVVAALTSVLAGRSVDRLGAPRVTIAGLLGMAAGSITLTLLPTSLGILGYLAPLGLITAGYALFQAANNTAVMAQSRPDQRGLIAGLLALSRNLGLISGAAVMGAVFALGAAADGIPEAPEAAVAGMRLSFAAAAALVAVALAAAAVSHVLARRSGHR